VEFIGTSDNPNYIPMRERFGTVSSIHNRMIGGRNPRSQRFLVVQFPSGTHTLSDHHFKKFDLESPHELSIEEKLKEALRSAVGELEKHNDSPPHLYKTPPHLLAYWLGLSGTVPPSISKEELSEMQKDLKDPDLVDRLRRMGLHVHTE